MNRDLSDISEKIRSRVAEVSAFDPEEITDDSHLFGDLGLDSIMLVDIFSTLSRDYPKLKNVRLGELEWQDDKTYSEFESLIYELLGLKRSIHFAPTQSSRLRLSDQPFIREFLDGLTSEKTKPFFHAHSGVATAEINIGGKNFINFSSYNYLNTNGSKRVTDAVHKAIRKYGTSVSAARIIGGEIPPHRNLEHEIASFLGVQDSLVQVGGHSTNVNVISHVVGPGDLVLHDALAHNSIVQGALASGAQRKPFRHNSAASLERELKRVSGRFKTTLVVVEGIYSMDGDLADLPAILDVTENYGAHLMVDEAHSLGTVGEGGRGVCSATGVDPQRIDILMGTLSKSLNSCGGYVAGDENIIRYFRYQLPGFLFSVGLSPSNTVAALESLRLLKENPNWVNLLRHRADHLRRGLHILGINTGPSKISPIIPWIVGDSVETIRLSQHLLKRGIYISPITYPAVPEKESRLRFFVSLDHSEEKIDQALQIVQEVVST